MPILKTEPAARLDPRAVAIMVLLCALWGVQQVASKVALTEGMPPSFQALLRSSVAGLLLLGWIGARQGQAGLRLLFARDGTLGAGLLIAAGFALEFLCLFAGVRLTSASRAVVLLFSGGFFTAVGCHFLIPAERLRASNAIGLVLAFAGVVATIAPSGDGGGSLAGDALVLGAATTWGLTTVVIKASPALAHASAEKVLGYQLFGSIPILMLASWAAGELAVPRASALAWASVVYQCVVVAFASYLAWFWLVGRYPAGRLAAFSFLTPLFGVVAAWALLGETLTPALLVGLALVCAGLRLVNRG